MSNKVGRFGVALADGFGQFLEAWGLGSVYRALANIGEPDGGVAGRLLKEAFQYAKDEYRKLYNEDPTTTAEFKLVKAQQMADKITAAARDMKQKSFAARNVASRAEQKVSEAEDTARTEYNSAVRDQATKAAEVEQKIQEKFEAARRAEYMPATARYEDYVH